MPSSSDSTSAVRPKATILGAVVEGWRRVLRAPMLTFGVLVLTWATSLPLGLVLQEQMAAQLGSSLSGDRASWNWDAEWAEEFSSTAQGVGATFTHEILGFGGTLATLDRFVDGVRPPRVLIGAVAFYLAAWLFLTGGILDRVARARPVSTSAFFGACGVYVFRFLRLAVVVGAAYLAVFRGLRPFLFGPVFGWLTTSATSEHEALIIRGWLYGLLLVALGLIAIVSDFAKVRMVVEDRHSALAALAAGGRFIRRRAWRCGGLFLMNILILVVLARLWLQVAPAATAPNWQVLLAGQVYLVARIWARLAFLASEVTFFQGELAHAQYTAAPEPVWPDSPAVEALRNLSSRAPR